MKTNVKSTVNFAKQMAKVVLYFTGIGSMVGFGWKLGTELGDMYLSGAEELGRIIGRARVRHAAKKRISKEGA